MKWREVMQIPYEDRKGRIPKGHDYRAAAKVSAVNGTEYLVLDFYRRKEKKAFMRAVYTRDDYGLYWPEINEKTSQRLTDQYNHIKATEGNLMGKAVGDKVFMTKEDRDTVCLFCLGKRQTEVRWITSWQGYVKRLEDDIVCERRRKKDERDRDRMQDRHADTPEIPDGFEDYAKGLLSSAAFLFYRKRHGKGTVRCSRCGEEYDIRYKRPDGIDGMIAHISEEPVDNYYGTCQCCGGSGIYKPIGRMKNIYAIQKPCYLIQPFRETGIVLREFLSEKIITLDTPEEVRVDERSRAYFLEGKEQIDWHVFGAYDDRWQYWNGGGMNPWKMKEGPVWPYSWVMIRSTAFGHSGCREYLMHMSEQLEEVSPETYFREYRTKPYLEMAVKTGLWRIVSRIVRYHYETDTIVPCPKAGKPADMLGIWPERLAMLRKEEGKISLLSILRQERDEGKRFTDGQIGFLTEFGGDAGIVRRILHYMNIQRFINRVEKYAGCECGSGCSAAVAALNATARLYLDYLGMQEAAGSDLSDQIIQHPRDLRTAHDRLVAEQNDEKNRQHCREKEAAFDRIRERYKALDRRYRYKADGLMIRPAASATEIIEEGRQLHHCVGGDNYLDKHNRGQTFILFLRAAAAPDIPYVTVEIEPVTNRIIQWYGLKDKKPDREALGAWLKTYTDLLVRYGDMEAMKAAVSFAPVQMEDMTANTNIRLMVAAG